MEFQIVRGASATNPFFWRIVGDEGTMLTFASAQYPTKEGVLAAVEEFKRAAATAPVVDLAPAFGAEQKSDLA